MSKMIKFEEAMTKLEEAVRLLESGNLTLDDSIEKYEDALKYVKICSEMLENAEQKVRILTENADGCISDKPFIQNEN
ncbi:MAG: exodeoxyribonuclease VII small subunit [Clostridia bacterium]|nr:exodeoxyribonuclease VII small subunit [Clostridia bacterium]